MYVDGRLLLARPEDIALARREVERLDSLPPLRIAAFPRDLIKKSAMSKDRAEGGGIRRTRFDS